MPRFSIRHLMLMTASVAAGFVMTSAVADHHGIDNRLMAFLLGAVSLLLAAGLVQQIVWSPPTSHTTIGQQTVRRLCLAAILCGIVLGIYRTIVPYPAPVDAMLGFQANPNEPIESRIALPLWCFSLTLASITAPWYSTEANPIGTRPRTHSKLLDVIVAVGVLAFCLVIICGIMASYNLRIAIPIQTDVCNTLSQGPAVGTANYVSRFGGDPQDFRDFVPWQIVTWPPLLIACFIVIGWGSRLRSTWCWISLAISMTPSCVNLWRLVGGQAKTVFPFQVIAFTENPMPDAVLFGLCFVLAVIPFATKSSWIHQSAHQTLPQTRATFATDHGTIGWTLMAIGLLGALSLFQKYFDRNWLYRVLYELGDEPHLMFIPILLFVGMQWQWRRFRFQDTGQERWPIVGNRQYWLIPLVAVVLLITVLTSIPFGIAILHTGL